LPISRIGVTTNNRDLTIFLGLQVLEESLLPLFDVMSPNDSGQFLQIPPLLDRLGGVLRLLQGLRVRTNPRMGLLVNPLQLKINQESRNYKITC